MHLYMFGIVVIRRYKCTRIKFVAPLVEKVEADMCCILRVLSRNINYTIWIKLQLFFSFRNIIWTGRSSSEVIIKGTSSSGFSLKSLFAFVAKQLSAILNANSAMCFPSNFPFLTKRRSKSRHLGTRLHDYTY